MNSQTNETAPVVAQPYKVPFNLRRFARTNSAQLGILGVFLTLWLIFIISAPKTFLSPLIYSAFMTSTPFFAIMAIPLTVIVIAKEMDLSFPSIMAMGMVAFSFAYNETAFIGSATVSTTVRVGVAIIAALFNRGNYWLAQWDYRCEGGHSFAGCHHRYAIFLAGCSAGAHLRDEFPPDIYKTNLFLPSVGRRALGICTHADGMVSHHHDCSLGVAKPP